MPNQPLQQPIQQDPFTIMGTRLNEIEEKFRLLKDRTILIGENLISIKEQTEEELFQIKQNLKLLEEQLKELTQINKKILYELDNLARKSELQILRKQFKMFEPFEVARIKDVKDIVKKEIKQNAE